MPYRSKKIMQEEEKRDSQVARAQERKDICLVSEKHGKGTACLRRGKGSLLKNGTGGLKRSQGVHFPWPGQGKKKKESACLYFAKEERNRPGKEKKKRREA